MDSNGCSKKYKRLTGRFDVFDNLAMIGTAKPSKKSLLTSLPPLAFYLASAGPTECLKNKFTGF